jgi:hypothetical protein
MWVSQEMHGIVARAMGLYPLASPTKPQFGENPQSVSQILPLNP